MNKFDNCGARGQFSFKTSAFLRNVDKIRESSLTMEEMVEALNTTKMVEACGKDKLV